MLWQACIVYIRSLIKTHTLCILYILYYLQNLPKLSKHGPKFHIVPTWSQNWPNWPQGPNIFRKKINTFITKYNTWALRLYCLHCCAYIDGHAQLTLGGDKPPPAPSEGTTTCLTVTSATPYGWSLLFSLLWCLKTKQREVWVSFSTASTSVAIFWSWMIKPD